MILGYYFEYKINRDIYIYKPGVTMFMFVLLKNGLTDFIKILTCIW